MTEYTDSNGEKRIRWGLIEWIGIAVVSIFGLGGVGSGIYANSTVEQLAEKSRENETRIIANETRDEALTARVKVIESSAEKWDGAVTKLERIDERTGRTAADVQQILREIRGANP